MDSITVNVNGVEQALPLETKEFKSGKTGFYAQGKVVVGNDKYQAQTILTKIVKK